MGRAPLPAPSAVEGAHLVLYDGVCGLCNRVLQLLLKYDRRAVFAFASLQSEVGRAVVERHGANPNEVATFYVVPNYRADHSRLLSRSRAALFVAGELGWPWKLALVAGVVPTAILDRVYNVVARNRYRLFGRIEQCLLPRPEFKRRFIDT